MNNVGLRFLADASHAVPKRRRQLRWSKLYSVRRPPPHDHGSFCVGHHRDVQCTEQVNVEFTKIKRRVNMFCAMWSACSRYVVGMPTTYQEHADHVPTTCRMSSAKYCKPALAYVAKQKRVNVWAGATRKRISIVTGCFVVFQFEREPELADDAALEEPVSADCYRGIICHALRYPVLSDHQCMFTLALFY